MQSQTDAGTILEVDFLDWANEWVGKQCLRCDSAIRHVPLGVSDGRSHHRIECDCAVIETSGRESVPSE